VFISTIFLIIPVMSHCPLNVVVPGRCPTGLPHSLGLGIAVLMLNLGAGWRWLVNAMHQWLYTGEKPHYTANVKLGGTQDWPVQVWRKSLVPLGFESWIILLAASRYID